IADCAGRCKPYPYSLTPRALFRKVGLSQPDRWARGSMSNPEQPFSRGNDPGKLGERLRLAREARGVSAEVASEQASVPIRYIRMFEEGRYPVVADPAYLTHFVRRYASYLGMDAWQASRDFIAETEPETALRRAGKLAAEPPTLEPTMTMTRPNSPNDKKSSKGGGGPPSGGSSKPPG